LSPLAAALSELRRIAALLGDVPRSTGDGAAVLTDEADEVDRRGANGGASAMYDRYAPTSVDGERRVEDALEPRVTVEAEPPNRH
jgi:hypothetical protein